MNDDGEVEALRSLVRLPWITQQHFVGMLQARRIDQVDVYFLFQWPWFYLWEQPWIADILSQASLRDVERQRCWKRGSGDGQRLWDYFTARVSDLSMPLTSEVRRSPEPSARPSAAADSEERQICTTCLFAESVGLCLCFLPSCALYKDNAVRNVVAEMGRDLVFMITARLSDLFHAVERWGSTLTCTVCTAADSEERQICTTCLFAESVGLWKRRRSYLYVCFLMYAFSHRDRGAHFCLRGGWGKRGDLTWHPAVKHQRPAAKTTTATVATAQRPK